MNEDRILSGKILFPAGTIPGLNADMTILVKYNLDENVEYNLVVYQNSVAIYGDDSDWDEGGE